jgi:hypothetical protein
MRLMKLSAFRELIYAEGSAPSLATLRGWIRAGKIPGGRFEYGRFWVDLHEYDRVTGLRDGIEAKREQLRAELKKYGLL